MSCNFSNIPGEIDEFTTTAHFPTYCCPYTESNGPTEDYDIPIMECQLCHCNSLTNTIAYVNEQGVFYKIGHHYQIISTQRNTYMCYNCLNNIESNCLD